MYIVNGNKEVLKFSLTNKDTGETIDDLSSATEIKFQIKESLDGDPVVSKTLTGGGIERDTPEAGDIQVTILPADYSSFTSYGDKYFAVQVEYSSTDIREILITEKGMPINTLELRQDLIT